jgi:uncharacterized protein YbjT (DUF2867 family)
MKRKAVIVGATGLVGKELAKLILEDESYSDLTIIVRHPMKDLVHEKLREKVVNFELLEELDVNFTGADVFCTLGTTIKKAGTKEAFRKVDYEYPLALGRIAKSQGSRQFLIITAMGASSSSYVFYNQVKGDVEEALKELKLPALKIFRPSLLLGKRSEFRIGEHISSVIFNVVSPVFIGPLKKYRAIQASSVAKGMIFAAKKDDSGITIYESYKIQQMSEDYNI